MTTKEIYKKKNAQRAVKVRIKVYDYGPTYFGEPTKYRLESLKFQTKTIRTYRRDSKQYSFVRCLINGKTVILVIKFEENQIERSSCVLLEKWDPRSSFI